MSDRDAQPAKYLSKEMHCKMICRRSAPAYLLTHLKKFMLPATQLLKLEAALADLPVLSII